MYSRLIKHHFLALLVYLLFFLKEKGRSYTAPKKTVCCQQNDGKGPKLKSRSRGARPSGIELLSNRRSIDQEIDYGHRSTFRHGLSSHWLRTYFRA